MTDDVQTKAIPLGLDQVQAFTDAAPALGDTGTLEGRFSQAIRDMGYHGFDAWAVTHSTFGNLLQPQNLWADDYGPEVIKGFIRDGLISTCPITDYASKTSEPFDYVAMVRTAAPNASVKFQLATLALYNVHHAWITPLNTIDQMRGVTLYLKGKGAAAAEHFARTRMAAQLISSAFMAAFVRVNAPGPVDTGAQSGFDLSGREIACMTWVAKGKTNWEISQILEISENTVRYHLKNAFRKLDATSRSSAVMRALQAGLISA